MQPYNIQDLKYLHSAQKIEGQSYEMTMDLKCIFDKMKYIMTHHIVVMKGNETLNSDVVSKTLQLPSGPLSFENNISVLNEGENCKTGALLFNLFLFLKKRFLFFVIKKGY